ncbi:hypothetical protein [Sulfitobacter donghicola]|nr:hypothetical protein [Sulfitobacter donghicola]KIN67227.1 hypothetical protein Z948_933 [Sulfitobacter donghicola DSW-25 = KCTC 12864 = JCM 14565]
MDDDRIGFAAEFPVAAGAVAHHIAGQIRVIPALLGTQIAG